MEFQDNLVREIQALFAEQLLLEVDSPDTDLLATGALDSMRLVDLLLLLEQRFGVSMPLETLDLDSFRCVRKIAELVSRSRSMEAAKPA